MSGSGKPSERGKSSCMPQCRYAEDHITAAADMACKLRCRRAHVLGGSAGAETHRLIEIRLCFNMHTCTVLYTQSATHRSHDWRLSRCRGPVSTASLNQPPTGCKVPHDALTLAHMLPGYLWTWNSRFKRSKLGDACVPGRRVDSCDCAVPGAHLAARQGGQCQLTRSRKSSR